MWAGATDAGPTVGGSARVRLYREGVPAHVDGMLSDIVHLAREPDGAAWLDLVGAGTDDVKVLDAALDLHDLALVDALEGPDRPSLRRYGTHLFVTAHPIVERAGRPRVVPVAAFVFPGLLVTVRPAGGLDAARVAARWRSFPEREAAGVAAPLYQLLQEVVDSHLTSVERLDERADDLEELVFADADRDERAVQRELLALRRDLARVRRAALPTREVLFGLEHGAADVVPAAMGPYFQDVLYRVLRFAEWSESVRDLVTSVAEANLAVQANRTDTIMKKVTSWAAIIAVPTAITGFYGQNVPFPGAGQPIGVLASVGLMAASSLALYTVFRRRDWL